MKRLKLSIATHSLLEELALPLEKVSKNKRDKILDKVNFKNSYL
jgi:hypothetical protein